MLGLLGLSYHAGNIPPFKNQNFEYIYFFFFSSKHSQNFSYTFLFPNLHRALYMSLPFRKKYQIQNWIKFTSAKSQLKFWDFSITSYCPNAKAPKFQLRFCGSKFYPILDLILFTKAERHIKSPM